MDFSEAIATAKGVAADACNAVRNGNAGQTVGILKRCIGDSHYAVRDDCTIQACAIAKNSRTNIRHTFRNNNISQDITIVERVSFNIFHAVRDGNAGQSITILEYIRTNTCKIVRDSKVSQTIATIKRVRTDTRYAARDGDVEQGAASAKRIATDICHVIRTIHHFYRIIVHPVPNVSIRRVPQQPTVLIARTASKKTHRPRTSELYVIVPRCGIVMPRRPLHRRHRRARQSVVRRAVAPVHVHRAIGAATQYGTCAALLQMDEHMGLAVRRGVHLPHFQAAIFCHIRLRVRKRPVPALRGQRDGISAVVGVIGHSGQRGELGGSIGINHGTVVVAEVDFLRRHGDGTAATSRNTFYCTDEAIRIFKRLRCAALSSYRISYGLEVSVCG